MKKVLCATDKHPQQATRIEKYQIIEELRKCYPLTRICHVLNIQPQSYYKWQRKGKPKMNRFNQMVASMISVAHDLMKGVYGTLRLKHYIYHQYGVILNHKLIRRYKKAFDLHVIVRKRKPLYLLKAKEKNLANKVPNRLDCHFTSKKPLEKLSSDVSYIQCTDTTLYLSAVKDIFNNEIISYSTSIKNNESLIIESYRQIPKANTESALIHTDQGSLYLAYEYVEYVKALGYQRSMSRRGCCWQNSPIENWFSQLKEEWLRPQSPLTRIEAKKAIEKYVLWYNTERIQECLGYLTPIQYKALHI